MVFMQPGVTTGREKQQAIRCADVPYCHTLQKRASVPRVRARKSAEAAILWCDDALPLGPDSPVMRRP